MVIKVINYPYSFLSVTQILSRVSIDTYFPISHSNRTYVVQQVIDIMCVTLDNQEHA